MATAEPVSTWICEPFYRFCDHRPTIRADWGRQTPIEYSHFQLRLVGSLPSFATARADQRNVGEWRTNFQADTMTNPNAVNLCGDGRSKSSDKSSQRLIHRSLKSNVFILMPFIMHRCCCYLLSYTFGVSNSTLNTKAYLICHDSYCSLLTFDVSWLLANACEAASQNHSKHAGFRGLLWLFVCLFVLWNLEPAVCSNWIEMSLITSFRTNAATHDYK